MAAVDHSVEGRLGATKLLLEHAQEREAERLQELHDAREEVRGLQAQVARLESLVAGQKAGKLTVEQVRDVAIHFGGGFTDTEVAAELEVEPKVVRKVIKAMVGTGWIKDSGQRIGGRPIYEYVPPEGPGHEFLAQQRLRVVPPPPEEVAERELSGPVAGTGEGVVAGVKKELVAIVKDAMADGWKLEQTGTNHYQLVRRGNKPVRFAGTPQNPSEEAKHLRRRLRQAVTG